MAGRSRRKRVLDEGEETASTDHRFQRAQLVSEGCWLCGRALEGQVQWHHFVPKSRGGRDTVPVHPICHKTLHVTLSNVELERIGDDIETLRGIPEIARFLTWVENKPPTFSAPVRRRKN